MAQQMNTILLLLVFIGLVGVMLVAFFTLEKVNDIATGKSPSKPRFNAADTFGGLSGKDLWDAMIGVPMRGITPKEIQGLKPRYEVVLQKHLEILFEEGQHDGREGFPMPVRCERVVPTLRGEIESWIPHDYASGIYKVGYSLVTEPDEDLDKLREKLDEIGDELFYAAGLPPIPLSKLLIPFKEEEELPPELPEEFPPEPEPEPVSDMAEVSDDADAQPVASLEAPVADEAVAEAAMEPAAPETIEEPVAEALMAEAPVASEGDVLPVAQAEKEAEPVPAG
mgnify:CR=1 FL=1